MKALFFASALALNLGAIAAVADDVDLPLPDRSIEPPVEAATNSNEKLQNWFSGTAVPVAQNLADGSNPIVEIARGTQQSIEYMLGSVSVPEWLGRVEVEAQFAGVESGDNPKPEFSILTVQPIFQEADLSETYFTQLQANYGYQFGDERLWANAGVGYRRVLDNNTLIGANSFLDYDIEEQHLRASLGGEFKFNSVDLSANYYQALTDEKSVTATFSEEALSGFDAEVRSQLPYLPWARAGLRHYFWNTEGADENIKGYEVNLELDIHQNFQLELATSDDNFGEQRYEARLRLVGSEMDDQKPVALSNRFIADRAFEPRDIRNHTLDKVRRENKIILEGVSSGIVIARGS